MLHESNLGHARLAIIKLKLKYRSAYDNSGMFLTQRVNIENFANVICYSHESVKKLKKHGVSQQKQKFISRQMELMDQDECFRHVVRLSFVFVIGLTERAVLASYKWSHRQVSTTNA